MNRRLLILSILVAVIVIAVIVIALLIPSGQGESKSPPADSPLLRLLRFVPDTPDSRQYLVYGDVAAWHASWGIPRIDNLEELNALERVPRAYWMYIMPRQTAPDNVLGLDTILQGLQRTAYGFDLFNLDRFLTAGQPPNQITVLEYSFDDSQIAGALTQTGYTAEALDTGGTLYSFGADSETHMDADLPSAGKIGALNRIALLDGQALIARRTDLITAALETQQGQTPSLADDPGYAAAVKALDDPTLKGTGDLVGVIFMDGAAFNENADLLSTLLAGPSLTPEQLDQLREKYGLNDMVLLFSYDTVALATRHTPGASYLITAAVLSSDTDPAAAAAWLGDRMQDYVSLVTQQPLSTYWTLDRTAGITIDGLPVAIVVMRVDDPPPTPDDAEQVNASVLGWITMVERRDIGYLYPWGKPDELTK
jgi:hypothetical protein